MANKKTTKKITRVGGGETPSTSAAKEKKSFVVSDESKAKSRNFRIIAIISWIVAIGFEIGGIVVLNT